jgi:hypothetical protein
MTLSFMVEMFTQRFKFSILDIGQLFLRTQLSYTFFFIFGNFFLFLKFVGEFVPRPKSDECDKFKIYSYKNHQRAFCRYLGAV